MATLEAPLGWSRAPRGLVGVAVATPVAYRGGAATLDCFCGWPTTTLFQGFFFFLKKFNMSLKKRMRVFRNFDSILIFACVVTKLTNRNNYSILYSFIFSNSYLFSNGLDILQIKRGLNVLVKELWDPIYFNPILVLFVVFISCTVLGVNDLI